MFYIFLFSPFSFTAGFMRANASVRPCISDDIVIHVVVKVGVFGFIGRRRTNKWMLLCESQQETF